MGPTFVRRRFSGRLWTIGAVVCVCLVAPGLLGAQQPVMKVYPTPAVGSTASGERFDTPQQAADAVVKAAGTFDVPAMLRIFGRAAGDILFTGETPRDRQRAADFAAQAKEKTHISMDPKGNRAYLIVGKEDWPFPAPLLKRGGKWSFDIQAGRQELLYRRIGANELDAITVCRGFVDAQYEYAFQKRQGYAVHQYAQRIISTPGKQDGLAWQNPDGTWGGPVGKNVARAIAQGYSPHAKPQPFHGYFFKILKGQGPAAPLGAMDFVVKGLMIGGFALAAAPAQYEVTGIKTFIVSYEGIVYQKDLGAHTLESFNSMTVYNPDKTWRRTDDTW